MLNVGSEGISSLFSKHICNQFCNAAWRKSTDQKCYIAAKEGPHMVLHRAAPITKRITTTGMAALIEGNEEDD